MVRAPKFESRNKFKIKMLERRNFLMRIGRNDREVCFQALGFLKI